MKRVKIIRTISKRGFISDTFIEAEDIIKEMAKEDYSYKGFVPYKIQGYGNIREIDLVFEKEMEVR